VGCDDGLTDGAQVGCKVGRELGIFDGQDVGKPSGCAVGIEEGWVDGEVEGAPEGWLVGAKRSLVFLTRFAFDSTTIKFPAESKTI
jgi:hypothetical protein